MSTIKEIEYYESLDELFLYNWDRYIATKDNNWLIRGYDGRQPKIDNEKLKELETKLEDDYFKIAGDDRFITKMQKWAKRDYLHLKYATIMSLVGIIAEGFSDGDMERRLRHIKQLEKFGYKMPYLNSEYGDMEELERIAGEAQGINTQIAIISDDLKENAIKDKVSLQKELILVSLGLELGYRLDAKVISVMEWLEMIKLLSEKNERNKK